MTLTQLPAIPTTARFAVLDGSDPAKWKPWQTELGVLVSEKIHKLKPATNTNGYREVFRIDLILVPRANLLERTVWTAVTGTLIDLSAPTPLGDVRKLHQQICGNIAASTNPLCKKVGYHVAVNAGALTDAHVELMDDLLADARARFHSIELPIFKVSGPYEIVSDEVFGVTFRGILTNMHTMARI